jgi:phage terminase Nu1 subunit (DNA packaging protein)
MEIDLAEPTRPQLAALLGCSSRWIGELRAKGEMPADGASWAENLEAWISIKSGGQDGDAPRLDVERARLAREQADAKAMDNAERRRELGSIRDMTTAVMTVITAAVARLSLVGAAVAKGDAKLRERIESAIDDALEELSMARVEEQTGGLIDGENPTDDAGD